MRVKIILAISLCLCLQACSREPKITGGHLITVKANSLTNTLFYAGNIQPLKTTVVTSPADGIVTDMPFQYGEAIKPGQLLFMMSSSKFLSDYKTALMAYIKAKNEFNTSQTQLSEAEFLHKHLLISDDDYKTKKSNFYGSQLGLLQAKDTLESIIYQLGIKDVDLYKLSISDIDKINKVMHLETSADNYLRITAPTAGVILAPSKGEEESKKINKGDAVKQGDVLAVIGDMTGLSVHIKVNELTVNLLKLGQKVKVTGLAFPDETLMGKIKRIDRQGEVANGGLPNFAVEVIVPALTKHQQEQIHVGMTAKVEIDIDEEPQITVPMTALVEKDGASYVNLYDPVTKRIQASAVKTGKTTLDSVEILSGLKTGDRIVVPD